MPRKAVSSERAIGYIAARMGRTDTGIQMGDLPPGNVPTLQLTTCPKCGYSLQGLPAAHRCPECGYLYDELTFWLPGISRGTSGMTAVRRVLWSWVILVPLFGPLCIMPLSFAGGMAGAFVLAVATASSFATVIYLMVTGKHEKKGMEQFLFTAGGFGPYSSLNGSSSELRALTPWERRHTVQLRRTSPRWHRLQIRLATDADARSGRTVFDALVRCDAPSATWIAQVLARRIDAAPHGLGPGTDTPPPGAGDESPTS